MFSSHEAFLAQQDYQRKVREERQRMLLEQMHCTKCGADVLRWKTEGDRLVERHTTDACALYRIGTEVEEHAETSNHQQQAILVVLRQIRDRLPSAPPFKLPDYPAHLSKDLFEALTGYDAYLDGHTHKPAPQNLPKKSPAEFGTMFTLQRTDFGRPRINVAICHRCGSMVPTAYIPRHQKVC